MSTLRAFTMPKWGIEMKEGSIGEWKVAEGVAFRKGEVIALIESDKISNEVEAEFDGTLVRVLAECGETYPVGALLAVMATGPAARNEIDAFAASFSGTAEVQADAVPSVAAVPNSQAAEPTSQTPMGAKILMSPAARAAIQASGIDASKLKGSGRKGRITHQDVHQALRPAPPAGRGAPVSIAVDESLDNIFASPLAKRMALAQGVQLTAVSGTGPRGRISKRDVLARIEPARAPGGQSTMIRMTPMRRAIARQVAKSKATIPHFYLRVDVRMDALLALRARAKESTGAAPSVNDYLIRACACALAEVPDVNILVHEDAIERFNDANVAVAVATDKGLFTVVVREAQKKNIAAISAEMTHLSEKARAGRLQPSDLEGATFTLSNLGMYGIDEFDAIINPPQGAILAVGAAKRRPMENDFALTFAATMRASLSCDHRAIDGATAARYLGALRDYLEHPGRLTD